MRAVRAVADSTRSPVLAALALSHFRPVAPIVSQIGHCYRVGGRPGSPGQQPAAPAPPRHGSGGSATDPQHLQHAPASSTVRWTAR
jgi:hypothetical protein